MSKDVIHHPPKGELEKKGDITSITIADVNDGDEALKLVGLERTIQIDDEAYRRVRWKLDMVIPPLCAAVYFTQYLVLGKYLGANVLLWGVVMALHAVPNSFGPFFVLRILLGMLESCVGPTLILIISMFYKKNEQTGVGDLFGGFVAYGISFDTNSGILPYKIMYLLTGALAILVGISVLLWMPDSPVHARFLTEKERIVAVERIRDDQGGTENKKFKKEQIAETLLDNERMLPIVWGLVPTIVGAAMLISLKGPEHKGALLFANYIVTTFGSALSVIYAYNASNTSGHTKKVTINAMTLAAFCTGNIIGAETFLPKDAPNYIPGKTAILVLLTSQVFICFLLRWVNLHLNKKKLKVIKELKERNNWTDEDIEKERQRHAFLDMTDRE
ncbi:hypothetical protein EIP86_007022 [Pleurotus ostreatoroseus]|nr:hypothetical protein EIP86_007022 [Pleurotus ostreatoroseus]